MSPQQRLAQIRAIAVGCVLTGLFGACVWLFLPTGPEPAAVATPVWQATPRDPVQLQVPRLGINSVVVGIDMDDRGVLDPPADVRRTGWWRGSARPGASTGQTLLTGHTVHAGGGVMNRLPELVRGDRVKVRTGRQVLTYRVIDVATWTKQQVADSAEELFGQDRHARRLVLVTCTDWEDGEYTANVVAFAEPVRSRDLPGRADAGAD